MLRELGITHCANLLFVDACQECKSLARATYAILRPTLIFITGDAKDFYPSERELLSDEERRIADFEAAKARVDAELERERRGLPPALSLDACPPGLVH